MKQKTWPHKSEAAKFTSLQLTNIKTLKFTRSRSTSTSNSNGQDFSTLPYDILTRLASSFNYPTLIAASLVCKSWRDGLKPLREAMLYLKWGKKFKHGKNGVKPNLKKAIDCFLKGAALGSTLAMVDAGLVYWELGFKNQAIDLYYKAALLGDIYGQCNLGLSYLQSKSPRPKEAINWLLQASYAGHVRAQYQLALCLHQGRGVQHNLQEAAKWYLKAAAGGYVRAMYNVALCYSAGEGLAKSHRQARKWMKRAADRGHNKAQFEHGLGLFSSNFGQEGEMMKAVVYLELASRSGETAAAHVKNVILQQLSSTSRDRVMFLADNWRALPSSH